MALSLSRKALLHRMKALIGVQRFIHTVPKDGNHLKLKQVKFDGSSEKNVTPRGNKLDATELGINREKISPSSSYTALKTLKNAGFRGYLVVVKDLILNKVSKDFDVITRSTLQKIKSLYDRAVIIGNNFPLCRFNIKDSVWKRFIRKVPKHGNGLELKQENNVTQSGNLDATEVGNTDEMISPSSYSVLNTLRNAGFESYLVCRSDTDLTPNKFPRDFDVITKATLEKVKSLFVGAVITRGRFPICRVRINDSVLEVSNFTSSQLVEVKQNDEKN